MTNMNPVTRKRGNDIVYTPEWVVDDMLDHFNITGSILDPCKGGGAFSNKITDCLWCEIEEGRDFFDWTKPVDWVISNPPYSLIRRFTLHAFTVSDNVVFLIPIWKAFNAIGLMKATEEYGGISHIRTYGGGGKLGFGMGNAIGAVYWQKEHRQGCTFSFYT